MTLRKITNDNSVRFLPKSEQTKEFKQNKMKKKKQSEEIQPISGGGTPNTRKQNKKFSKVNKNFVKDFTAGGFAILK